MQFGIPSVSLQLAKILGVKWHLLELLFLQCLLMQKLTLKCNQSKITNKQDKNIVCACSRWSFLSQVFLWKEAKRSLLFLFWYSGKWQLDLKYEREMSFAVPPWCTKNISAGEDRPHPSEWGNTINSPTSYCPLVLSGRWISEEALKEEGFFLKDTVTKLGCWSMRGGKEVCGREEMPCGFLSHR